MKSSIKVAVVAFFAIGISAYAQDSFIRPELSYVKIANNLSFSHADDTKSPRGTIGYGIAGGAIVGDQGQHEISLSLQLDDSKASVSQSTPFSMDGVNYSSGTDSIKLKTTTLLLNYRYYFGARANPVRFYVGPSLGYTHIQGSEAASAVEMSGTVDTDNGSDTRNPWTTALSLGVAVKLADKIDLDLGYRYTYGISKSWGNFLEHLRSNSLYAGVGFKF